MRMINHIALVFQLTTIKAKEEPTPWGLLAFIGLGLILYVLLVIGWVYLDSFFPRAEWSTWYKVLDKIFAYAGIFIFFIVITSIRQGFETLWGRNTADAIGIICETVLIVVMLVILSSKNDS
jgi:hypothetical protein